MDGTLLFDEETTKKIALAYYNYEVIKSSLASPESFDEWFKPEEWIEESSGYLKTTTTLTPEEYQDWLVKNQGKLK